jgi:uncharacterized coiled-coil protein SlyX
MYPKHLARGVSKLTAKSRAAEKDNLLAVFKKFIDEIVKATALRAKTEELKEGNSSLDKISVEAAALLLSVLETRTVAGSEEQQKLSSRCEALERTVQELQQHVDELRNVIQRNGEYYDRLEDKFNNLQKRMTAVESKKVKHVATTSYIF